MNLPSEEPPRELLSLATVLGSLERERARAEFRQQVLESFLVRLFTYEMPLDKVRGLMEHVVTHSLQGFRNLHGAEALHLVAKELCERIERMETIVVEKKLELVLADLPETP